MNGYINLGRKIGHQLAMASFQVVSLAFLLFSAIPSLGFPNETPSPAPVTEDSNEECHPKPPEPGKPREECCALPGSGPPSEDKRKLMKECVEMLKDDFPPPPPPPAGHPPPPPPEGDKPKPPPPPHHRPPPPPGHRECIEECEFNKTGHLTADLKLNSEEIMKTFLEEYGKEEVWKPIVEQAVKTCATSATEDVKEDTKCKSGAHQFMKCFRKQLFLNCPSNVWKSSESCNAEKELVNKCKDYTPPPPPPPLPTSD